MVCREQSVKKSVVLVDIYQLYRMDGRETQGPATGKVYHPLVLVGYYVLSLNSSPIQ